MKAKRRTRIIEFGFLLFTAILFLSTGCTQYFHKSTTYTLKVAENPKYGKILVDGKGMTLYIFKKDKYNESYCYNGCAKKWPPLLATKLVVPPELKGKVWLIKRKDGTQQVAYEGQPLYYFFKDKKPGDTFGQGKKGVWFVVEVK